MEDDEALRLLLERELRQRAPAPEAWRVVAVGPPDEGARAVADAPAHEPLLVVADHDLRAPRTGAQLLEEVARVRPDATRVLISGRPRAQLEAAIRGARPAAFLEKGSRVDRLVDAILALVPTDRAATDEPSYREMVENATDHAIVLLDAHGLIRRWNAAAARMTGYAPDEAKGKPLGILYPPAADVDRRLRVDLKVATEDGRHEETGWRMRQDGTMFWANVVITRILAPDGRPTGFVVVARDLTEQRHHDEVLRESEERYRLIVEGVRDYAIFMLDPSGRVASWNTGAERIKGYSADEIIGEHFSRFYTEPDRARGHPDHELRLAAAHNVYEEEGWRVRKDGSRFWANVVITALRSPQGQLRGFAKVTRDLTERRLAEEALRTRASELAEVARELEAFNYTVAHDLRAPLRAVIHLSALLATRDDAPMGAAEERKLVDAIHRSSVRMGELVEDLLALSRATKGPLEPREADLTEVARSAAAEVARHIGASPQVQVAEGLAVRADPRLLRIVMENLLSNAIKFSRVRPDARVEVGRIDTGSGPAFYVRDNGVGFDERLADRLFRPFQRLHDPNQFEGTGIGLATVARIVARHGGRVWAESRAGQGATFYFTLGSGEPAVTPADVGEPRQDASWRRS